MKQNETLSLIKPFLPFIISTAIALVVGAAVNQAILANTDRRINAAELQISRSQLDVSDIKTDIGIIKERTNAIKEDVKDIKDTLKERK